MLMKSNTMFDYVKLILLIIITVKIISRRHFFHSGSLCCWTYPQRTVVMHFLGAICGMRSAAYW